MTHRLSPSRAGKWLVLLGPYDQGLVDALKAAVPASAREWRPIAKCWRISPEYREVVEGLIARRERHA